MLDRLIAYFAPESGLRRAVARVQLAAVRDYEGAKDTRRTRGWRPGSRGPNAEVAKGQRKLRDRARDLVRNNPWISGGVTRLVDYEIGTGIRPRSRTGTARIDRQVNRLFEEWAAQSGFYAAQRAMVRSRIEAGEGLGVLATPSAAEMREQGLAVPLLLQVLEPDQIADGLSGKAAAGNTLADGVEVTPAGRVVAYHLYKAHPADQALSARMFETQRVPADRVLHLYRPDRPGQRRGVSGLHSVLIRARMLDELEDAAIEQAKVAALVAAFTTSQGGAASGPLAAPRDGETGERRRTMSPGMIHALQPGEDVEFNSPPSAGGLPEHFRHQLRAIANGLDTPYDVFTGDLSQSNYSSLRAGRLTFRRRLEVEQWLVDVPVMCEPVWRAFISAAILAGLLKPRAEGYPCEWAPPRFELLDPQAEAKGILAEIRMGLKTEPQAISEVGWDPEAQLTEIAEWNAKKDALGVVTDGDPRRVGGNGQVQSTGGAAADETAAAKGEET